MTLKKLLLTLLISFGISFCYAQLPLNLIKSDSTLSENFNYIAGAPTPNQTKGVVVLLPGLFDPPLSIFFESDLPLILNKLNYSIIIPVLSQKGDKFDLSDRSLNQLVNLITQYIQTTNLRQDVPIILGGFSIGGTRILKACTFKDNSLRRLNIRHVFVIDPPMDLNRLLNSEAKYGQNFLKGVIEKEMGTVDAEKLASLSILDINKIDSTKPITVNGVKIRIYNEPAIEWQMENRKRDLLDINLLDQSVYVNHIKRKHPDIDIQLIISKIEGLRRQTGDRNPHSWNIVDTDEFIDWISK